MLFLGYALMWVPPRARRWRLERRLARLVTVLASVPSGDALVLQLQRATRDDSLAVRYWSPGRDGYVNGDGAPEAHPSSSARVLTSVQRAGRPVAVIDHSGRVDAAQLERAIDPVLRVMLENAQLRAASLAELAELTDSRARIVQRAEVERRQLERNLHDGAQQRAVSLALMVRMLVNQADVDGSRPAARQAPSLAGALLAELRAVARGIYPAMLTDSGLAGAADDLAERSRDVAVVVRHVPTGRYAPVVERTAYLVLEAACADARARGATLVTIRGIGADPLMLEVTDDAIAGPPQVGDLEDQVHALEGEMIVGSHQGRNSVQVKLPCES
jgi:signal transduction histidine kinase